MNDPRKDLDRRKRSLKKDRFTPARLAKICNHLESNFQDCPLVSKAARQVSISIQKNGTVTKEDLATVLIEILYRQTIAKEKHLKAMAKKKSNATKKHSKPALKALQSKATPPQKTGFSKEIEKKDQENKGRKKRPQKKDRP